MGGRIWIDGVPYYTAADVARAVSVTRQTLWRWRNEGKVPAGQRYRDRQVLFTEDEFQSVREYANRLEPAGPVGPRDGSNRRPELPRMKSDLGGE